MRVRPSQVRHILLDDSFINALLATDAPQHDAACQLYRTLVDNYQMGSDRLYGLSTVLGDLPTEFRRNALAPLIRLNVARQHRVAAARMSTNFTPAAALSLVMMRRERVKVVATAAHTYDALDIEVLSVADAVPMTVAEPVPVVGADADVVGGHVVGSDVVAAAAVSSGSESTPVPRSTDGSSPTEP
ncbi:MAG: hypothetical protein JWN62_534 [Acidimicrobiales bacterium]|nr:hypothetical protein [Acidimicrobiales bacterium]